MGYIGVNVKDSKIIKSICNRASDRNDKLDKFSDKNIKKDKPKNLLSLNDDFEFVQGENFKKRQELKELRRAGWNYVQLMRHHHPFDVGPIAMYTVLLDRMDDAGVTDTLVRQYFADTVNENAARACRSQKPMTHPECLSLWTSLYPIHGKP